MKNVPKNVLFVVISVVLFVGCQCQGQRRLPGELSWEPIKWKAGSFSDLNKEAVSVMLSNSEPNFNRVELLYEENYSERAVQIVDMIKSAEAEEDHPEIPLFSLPEQFWIAFNDGTGSVFPTFYNGDSYCVRSVDGVRRSDKLFIFLEWLHIHQIDHQQKKKIVFDQVSWKAGSFSDLKKEAVGMILSNSEPNLDFAKASAKEDLSEEAARIAYLFGHPFDSEDSPCFRSLGQQLWIVFADATGSVFECEEDLSGYCSMKSGNIIRRNQLANDVLELIRRRNKFRQEKGAMGLTDPNVFMKMMYLKDPNVFMKIIKQ